MNSFPRVDICGIKIDNCSMKEAVEQIDGFVRQGKPCYGVTPNVDHLVRLQGDAQFRYAYNHAALVVADGMPVIWASHFLDTPLKEKVSGSDLFLEHCRDAARRGHRLFFMGGRPGAAQKAKENLERMFPGIKIVGVNCPPMGFDKDPEANARILQEIRAAAPDVLYVGLGAPKQENWIAKYYVESGVPFTIGIGATFEFVSGYVRRAPRLFQRYALEWFWRLAHEPTRLSKRYLVEDPEFLWLVLRQKFGKKGR